MALLVVVLLGGGAAALLLSGRGHASTVVDPGGSLPITVPTGESEVDGQTTGSGAASSEGGTTTGSEAGSSATTTGGSEEGAQSGSETGTSSTSGGGSGGSTTGSPGAAASSNGAPVAANGPASTIRAHLEDLQDGQYQAAFELMSNRYRAANPGWPSERQAADPTIHIVTVGSPNYTPGAARVRVHFDAQDVNSTPNSDTECREFSGVVSVVHSGGTWRYEPSGDDLNSTVRPSSDCGG